MTTTTTTTPHPCHTIIQHRIKLIHATMVKLDNYENGGLYETEEELKWLKIHFDKVWNLKQWFTYDETNYNQIGWCRDKKCESYRYRYYLLHRTDGQLKHLPCWDE